MSFIKKRKTEQDAPATAKRLKNSKTAAEPGSTETSKKSKIITTNEDNSTDVDSSSQDPQTPNPAMIAGSSEEAEATKSFKDLVGSKMFLINR